MQQSLRFPFMTPTDFWISMISEVRNALLGSWHVSPKASSVNVPLATVAHAADVVLQISENPSGDSV